jgi:hypothetical protein
MRSEPPAVNREAYDTVYPLVAYLFFVRLAVEVVDIEMQLRFGREAPQWRSCAERGGLPCHVIGDETKLPEQHGGWLS